MRVENSTSPPIKGWRHDSAVMPHSQSPKSLIFNVFFMLKD